MSIMISHKHSRMSEVRRDYNVKHKKIYGIATVVVTAALLAGCSGGSTAPEGDSGATATTDTVRATIDIPSTFDPAMGRSLGDYVSARQSFDTLVRQGSDGQIGGLATDWESTNSSATFNLRDDATCSDGTAITPTIVKNSLDRLATSGGSNVPEIFGDQVPTVSADDAAGTVSIELETPWQDLLAGLATSPSGIVCPAGLADLDALAAGTATGAESGPYVLASAEPGVRYNYELRDGYTAWPEWPEVTGTAPKNLEFVISPDTSATTNLVLDGQLDIAKIMPESTGRFADQKGYEVTAFPFSDFYIIFNEREGSPFADPKIRKAVAQTINLEEFKAVALDSFGSIPTSLVNSGASCYADQSAAFIPEDLEAAAKVLDGVKIRIVAPLVIGTNGAGNVYIQERLRAAGADVELQNVDLGAWISTVFGEPGGWDFTVYPDLNFSASLASPLGKFMGEEPANGGGNIGATQAPAAQAAFDAARVAETEAEYCGLLNDSMEVILSDAHAVPLVTEEYIYVQRPGFTVTMQPGALDDHVIRITP